MFGPVICPQCSATGDVPAGTAAAGSVIRCGSCGRDFVLDFFDQITLQCAAAGVTGRYYDRAGLPISVGEWARRCEVRSYVVLAKVEVGALLVSTIWTGLNTAFAGPPRIFETMLFPSGARRVPGDGDEPVAAEDRDEPHAGWARRYATEAEALAGHEEVVEWVRSAQLPGEFEKWLSAQALT